MNQVFDDLREAIEENSVVCGNTRIIDSHTVRVFINKAESKVEEKKVGKKPLVNKCPCCNKTVFYVENYCPNCGQHLNWNGVE